MGMSKRSPHPNLVASPTTTFDSPSKKNMLQTLFLLFLILKLITLQHLTYTGGGPGDEGKRGLRREGQRAVKATPVFDHVKHVYHRRVLGHHHLLQVWYLSRDEMVTLFAFQRLRTCQGIFVILKSHFHVIFGLFSSHFYGIFLAGRVIIATTVL